MSAYMNAVDIYDASAVAHLVKRMQRRPQQYHDVFYRTYWADSYRLAFSILHQRQDAEDAAHLGLIRALEKVDTLKNPKAATSWVRQIVSNVAIDQSRAHESRMAGFAQSDIDQLDEWPEDILAATEHSHLLSEEIVMNREVAKIVFGLVKELSDKRRQAVILYYYVGLSTPEIAERLKVSEGSVRSLLFHARETLNARIQEVERTQDIRLYSTTTIPMSLAFREATVLEVPTPPPSEEVLKRLAGDLGKTAVKSGSSSSTGVEGIGQWVRANVGVRQLIALGASVALMIAVVLFASGMIGGPRIGAFDELSQLHADRENTDGLTDRSSEPRDDDTDNSQSSGDGSDDAPSPVILTSLATEDDGVGGRGVSPDPSRQPIYPVSPPVGPVIPPGLPTKPPASDEANFSGLLGSLFAVYMLNPLDYTNWHEVMGDAVSSGVLYEALRVYNDPYATQEQVDVAKAALDAAIARLRRWNVVIEGYMLRYSEGNVFLGAQVEDATRTRATAKAIDLVTPVGAMTSRYFTTLSDDGRSNHSVASAKWVLTRVSGDAISLITLREVVANQCYAVDVPVGFSGTFTLTVDATYVVTFNVTATGGSDVGETFVASGIEWRILALQGAQRLIISEHVLFDQRMNATATMWGTLIRWTGSELRSELNGETASALRPAGAWYGALDPGFIATIRPVPVQTKIGFDGAGGYELTLAQEFFLLSEDEVFGSSLGGDTSKNLFAPKVLFADEHARKATVNSSSAHWWLRSPRTNTSNVALVRADSGLTSSSGADGIYGVRPACVVEW